MLLLTEQNLMDHILTNSTATTTSALDNVWYKILKLQYATVRNKFIGKVLEKLEQVPAFALLAPKNKMVHYFLHFCNNVYSVWRMHWARARNCCIRTCALNGASCTNLYDIYCSIFYTCIGITMCAMLAATQWQQQDGWMRIALSGAFCAARRRWAAATILSLCATSCYNFNNNNSKQIF